MFIDPYFLQCHDEKMLKPPPGFQYRIVGYSQYAEYTLTKWQYGNDEEFFMGEALYRGYELIASGGGRLSLAVPQETPSSVWDRVDPNAGAYGVSAYAARELRDLSNYVPLVF